MTLQEALLWLVTGGAAVLAYFLMEKVAFLARLSPIWKRPVAIAIAFVLAQASFLLQVHWGYAPLPIGEQAWAESIFVVGRGAVAAMLSQLIHGAAKLKGSTANEYQDR